MKICFVTMYFPPELGAAPTRIHELAVRMGRLGHDVSVLTTFPNYPSGVVPREWRGKFFWKGKEQGTAVYRIWSYPAPNRGFLKRIISHLSFCFFASLAALFLPNQDFLVLESPPLFNGFVGVLWEMVKPKRYAFMVSDLWPESAVQMGMLKNRFLIWASRQMELLIYRRAALVLCLTEGIRNAIVRDGITPSKVALFRNSVDCEFFRPGIDSNVIRCEMGMSSSEFLAVYAGIFGLAQNLSTVLEAAALLQARGDNNVRIVLAGDGAQSELLKAKARAMRLENVRFLDPLPKARMPELLNAADCVLVPLRGLHIFSGALPTKLFEAMACGKPVVLGVEGEAEQLVRAADAGYCIRPETPLAICDVVLQLMNHPADAFRMGASGRMFVEQHFNRERRARELSTLLRGGGAEPSRQPPATGLRNRVQPVQYEITRT